MTTIDITFTGLANGRTSSIQFTTPFTSHFTFDTDKGTLSDYRLNDGLVSAYIDLEGYGTWSNSQWGPGSTLTWTDNLGTVIVNTGTVGTYSYLITRNDSPNGFYGFFQFGLCPTSVGGPCGFMSSAELTSITGLPLAVPGPLVGTGIPGLLIALCGMCVLARRRRAKCA